MIPHEKDERLLFFKSLFGITILPVMTPEKLDIRPSKKTTLIRM
jgi:hypothetical protein